MVLQNGTLDGRLVLISNHPSEGETTSSSWEDSFNRFSGSVNPDANIRQRESDNNSSNHFFAEYLPLTR